MTTAAIEPAAPRTGTLRNGGKAAPLTDEIRQKSIEARRRRKAEREMSRAEKANQALVDLLDVLDLRVPGDRRLKLDTAREILDRDEGKPIQRVQAVQLSVSARLAELSEQELDALIEAQGLSQSPLQLPPAP